MESGWLAYFGQGQSREMPSKTCRLKEPTKGQRPEAQRVQSQGAQSRRGEGTAVQGNIGQVTTLPWDRRMGMGAEWQML